jgi:histidinol-phosphatase (PHP family)
MVMLPADGHVHTEWSWDTVTGDMEASCARAVELGLPAIAFADHMDFTAWAVVPDEIPADYEHLKNYLTPNDDIQPPPMDVAGYFACLERCRSRFPQLRLIAGTELGEAHRHPREAAALLRQGEFERVLGSVHSLSFDGRFLEPDGLYREWPAAQVMREFLAEVRRLIRESDAFTVLTHIDYAVRTWPGDFVVREFEDEFRQTLRLLAETGRALEVNTIVPLAPEIVEWWHEEGGEFVAFGSDAHAPDRVGRGLAEAAAIVLARGFVPGTKYTDFWVRG